MQNAYFLAKIGADTAENEQHFAEILPIGRRVADRCRDRRGEAPAAAAAEQLPGRARAVGERVAVLRSESIASKVITISDEVQLVEFFGGIIQHFGKDPP